MRGFVHLCNVSMQNYKEYNMKKVPVKKYT